MQLFLFFIVFLFTSAESSSVEAEKDMLASLDVFAFGYSQQASQQWDCSQVINRVKKAEESRIWRTVIPDAQIEEKTFANESAIFLRGGVYEWEKVCVPGNSSTRAKGSFSIQNTAFLDLRKPNLDGYGSSNSVKAVLSKSKRINKRALAAMLPQLEQAKNMIMKQMAAYQIYPFSPKMAPKASGSLVKRYLRMPQATNYHPRVFRDAHFTTADLVAWMMIAAKSNRGDQQEGKKLFTTMVRSFLPGFNVSVGKMSKGLIKSSTKVTYVCHIFQYTPAGADTVFYFDGNHGKLLLSWRDSILLGRPKGIVDCQQHNRAVLFSEADVKASSLIMHQTEAEVALRRSLRDLLEGTLVLQVPSEATDAEVQAYGVAEIRRRAARF